LRLPEDYATEFSNPGDHNTEKITIFFVFLKREFYTLEKSLPEQNLPPPKQFLLF
jgi:hypothetical protein